MIEIQAKIHDKFSIEFKVGFITRKRLAISDFVMNTWIFVPHSLDINPMTYDKTRFYRDIKSNVRLITPVYLLRDLATTDTLPFQELEKHFDNSPPPLPARQQPNMNHKSKCSLRS